MYEGMGDGALELETNNYTYNMHDWGVSPATFQSD